MSLSKFAFGLTLFLQIGLITGTTWESTAFWEETFTGSTLNTSKWTNGRNENTGKHAQHYEDDAIQFDTDGLVIESYYSAGYMHDGTTASNFKSGAIVSKKDFTYPVKIEISAKLPEVELEMPTRWTAFWLQRSGVVSGETVCYQEYDILEHYLRWRTDPNHTPELKKNTGLTSSYHFNTVGTGHSTYGTCFADQINYPSILGSDSHLFCNYNNQLTPGPTMTGAVTPAPTKSCYNYYPGTAPNGDSYSNSFHTWTIEWDKDSFRLEIDGTLASLIETGDTSRTGKEITIPYQPMQLIINVAMCKQGYWCDQATQNDHDQTNSSIISHLHVKYVKAYHADVTPSPTSAARSIGMFEKINKNDDITEIKEVDYKFSPVLIAFIMVFFFVFMVCMMVSSGIYIYNNLFAKNNGNVKYSRVLADITGNDK